MAWGPGFRLSAGGDGSPPLSADAGRGRGGRWLSLYSVICFVWFNSESAFLYGY